MKNYIYIISALAFLSAQSLIAQDISLTNANMTKPSTGQEFGKACFTVIAEDGVGVTTIPFSVEVSLSKVSFEVSNISGFNSDYFSWSVDPFSGNVIRGTLIDDIPDVDNGGGGAQICIPVKRSNILEYADNRNGYVVNILPGSLDQGGNSGSDYTSRFGFSNAAKTNTNEQKSNDVDHTDMEVKEIAYNINTENISVFPNPSIDVLNVEAVLDGMNYSISLYDINGRVKASGPFDGSKSIEVNNWAPGMYIMEIQNNDNGYKTTERVMVAN